MKMRKEVGGVINLNGNNYETIGELKDGLKDGEITKEQYDTAKDQIKSLEWRQEHAIKDPAYLTAKRVMQTIQNVAIKRYMDMIASQHPSWVKDIKGDEPTPKGYTRLGSSYSWGPFRNKAVIDHIVEDFVGFKYANAVTNSLYDAVKLYDRTKLVQFYKKWRTCYNPFVSLGNISGNVFFATVNGINPFRFIKEMVRVGNISKKNPDRYEDMLKSGLIGDVAMTGEFNLKDLPLEEKGTFKRAVGKPVEWYVNADNRAKIAAYNISRETGLSHKEALQRAYDAFQNYSTVGKTWDLCSKIPIVGPTFGKFQGDLQRIMINNIMTAPLATAGTFILISALRNLTSSLSGETEEEKKIRESRTGVPQIPIINMPLSFKIGNSEVNFARYMTPLFIYPQGDSEMDFAEYSKFLPLQFQKKEKENLFPIPAFADATWGWLGSVLADRDFRMMSIQDPYSRRYSDVGITTDERIKNVIEFAMRSQMPFYKGVSDIHAGATGQLDYYDRKRDWKQAILNNFVKVQTWDDVQMKNYVESNIDYLTNRFSGIVERAGNANKELYKQIKKAEDKELSQEAVNKIYERESKLRDKRLSHSLDLAIPILDELEEKINTYKKWFPNDTFVGDAYRNIESGKLRRLSVMDERDVMKNYWKEYKLLKENNMLRRPEMPRYFPGTEKKVTTEQQKQYSEDYWSWYLRYLDMRIGLTQEEFDDAGKIITGVSVSTREPGLIKETYLQKRASEASAFAKKMADARLGIK